MQVDLVSFNLDAETPDYPFLTADGAAGYRPHADLFSGVLR